MNIYATAYLSQTNWLIQNNKQCCGYCNSGIASHFAPQIQANTMQQHFRIALIAMQNNARVIALSSANLPLTFGSDQRLDYCG